MRRYLRLIVIGTCVLGFSVAVASAQTTTTTTTKKFEIISVAGNVLVVRGPDGTREINVPDNFKFTVDGKELSVRDLKAGMSGTATVTTTMTEKPVVVTTVKNAKVMQAFGNAVIVRSDDGKFKQFTEADAKKRNVQITRNGQLVEFQQLHAGDMLTATFVTETAPQVMTEQQVNASLAKAGAAPMAAASTPAAAAPKPAAAAPAPKPAATAPAAEPAAPKKLPKTASPLPLMGLVGVLFLAIGASMTIARRRRTA